MLNHYFLSTMTHQRIIPRDLFNEGKLLKALGFLGLAIHDCSEPMARHLEFDHDGSPFDVQITDGGFLYAANLHLFCCERQINLFTTYNTKAVFPLQFEHEDDVNVFGDYVFNEDGFTDEFNDLIDYLAGK